jgi:hypothetical protein
MKCVKNLGIPDNIMCKRIHKQGRGTVEQMMGNVEVPCAHYLVENTIFLAPHTYPLQHKNSHTSHRPSCKAKIKNLALVFIILYKIKHMRYQIQLFISHILNHVQHLLHIKSNYLMHVESSKPIYVCGENPQKMAKSIQYKIAFDIVNGEQLTFCNT